MLHLSHKTCYICHTGYVTNVTPSVPPELRTAMVNFLCECIRSDSAYKPLFPCLVLVFLYI